MNLKSMTLPELTAVLKELGQPAFRAKQVYTWLHRGVRAYDEMTNLPKSLRDTLAREYPICAPKVVRRQESTRDGTIKYLWELSDGNCVETVLMRYHYGNTVCISTEVGCRMGCAFCASTIGGLVRRLEPYEMLDEVLFTQVDSGLPISHIVLMGIGEPLDNFDNVMRFLELVNSPEGMKFGGAKVVRYKDYKDGVDGLPASNVLQMWMEDGSEAVIRPSGTEPKIKVYTEKLV